MTLKKSNSFLTVNFKNQLSFGRKKNNSNFRFEGVLSLNMILDQSEALVVAKARKSTVENLA